MIRSHFYVYLDDEGVLNYVREPCAPVDREELFSVHLIPADADDLPDYRKRWGFGLLDFYFDSRGVVVGERCVATVRLPKYAVARVLTGQPGIWKGEFSPAMRGESD